jgi:PhnB protein
MVEKKVKAIPYGYHVVTPYLTVRDAAQAIEFYKKAFGAEERVRMPGPDGKIMHAELRLGDSVIMLGEENLAMSSPSPASLGGTASGIMIYCEDVDQAFDRALRSGAKAIMPPADMFWGDRYGQLVDPFGHKWSIGTHVKDMSPDEMKKAQDAWMKEQAHAKKG